MSNDRRNINLDRTSIVRTKAGENKSPDIHNVMKKKRFIQGKPSLAVLNISGSSGLIYCVISRVRYLETLMHSLCFTHNCGTVKQGYKSNEAGE